MLAVMDRVVVVTGASSGIGRACAINLHTQGARLVLVSRREDRLKDLALQLGQNRAVYIGADVRSPEMMSTVFEQASSMFGRVDALIANAGVGAYGGIRELSDTKIREIVDTNVMGTIWSVRSALPYLIPSKGDIVIVSSVAGLRGKAEEAVYAASKHALVGLGGSLDRELRHQGVRVSILCPGATATEFAMGAGREPETSELTLMMQPEDVAEAVSAILAQPRSLRTLLWSMRSMNSEH